MNGEDKKKRKEIIKQMKEAKKWEQLFGGVEGEKKPEEEAAGWEQLFGGVEKAQEEAAQKEALEWWVGGMTKRAEEKKAAEEKPGLFGRFKGKLKGLKALAAPEAAAAEAAGEEVTSKAKFFGKWYLILIFIFLIVFLIFYFVAGAVGFIAGLPLHFMLLAIGIILAIIVGIKSRRAAAAILLLFLVLSAGVWYFFGTETGSYIAGKAKIGGIQVGQAAKSFTGPLNVMKQIFLGTYNPEQLWSSDVAQEEYSDVKDVGIKMYDVAPIKSSFTPNEPIVITGRLDAVSFPDTNVTVAISASGKYDNTLTSFTCNPSSISIQRLKNRYFSCNLSNLGKEAVMEVTVDAKAQNTTTIAGRQFVYSTDDAISKYEDPLKAWGFTKDSLKSWQKGDENMNLGIGISGNPEILLNNSPYYLGVTIQNPTFSKNNIESGTVYLILPKNLVSNSGKPDFSKEDCSKDVIKNITDKMHVSLSDLDCYSTSFEKLEPAESENKLIEIKPELSGNVEYNSFFVLAIAQYNYVASQTIPVEVKGGS